MGLAAKAIVLSEDIHSYFEALQNVDVRYDMSLMLMRGAMLLKQTDLLLKEIFAVTTDPEIGTTAAQLFHAVKIDENALKDVLKTLQDAKNTKELLEEVQVVSKIKTLEERIKEHDGISA